MEQNRDKLEYTLEDFFRIDPLPPRREYPHYHPLTAHESALMLTVRLSWLASALEGDYCWCSLKEARKSGPEWKPERYRRAIATIEKGQTIYMPELAFRRGRTCVVDGRHRLYALLDSGYTHVSVRVHAEYVPMIATMCEKGEEAPVAYKQDDKLKSAKL